MIKHVIKLMWNKKIASHSAILEITEIKIATFPAFIKMLDERFGIKSINMLFATIVSHRLVF